MLIEAPCRLGEWFTHHRTIGSPARKQMLTGIQLFVWHCGIDGVTLVGAQTPTATMCMDIEEIVRHINYEGGRGIPIEGMGG